MRRLVLGMMALAWFGVGCGREVHYPPPDTRPRAEETGLGSTERWVKDLKARDPRDRAQAAAFLGNPGAKAAVPPLIGALSDPDAKVRAAAARSLGNIGPTAKEAIGPLTNALKDGEDKVKAAAAEALGNIGREAKPAVAALIDLFKSSMNGNVRVEAARALKIIDSEAAEKAGVPLP